jgi:hypothetical protein
MYLRKITDLDTDLLRHATTFFDMQRAFPYLNAGQSTLETCGRLSFLVMGLTSRILSRDKRRLLVTSQHQETPLLLNLP